MHSIPKVLYFHTKIKCFLQLNYFYQKNFFFEATGISDHAVVLIASLFIVGMTEQVKTDEGKQKENRKSFRTFCMYFHHTR